MQHAARERMLHMTPEERADYRAKFRASRQERKQKMEGRMRQRWGALLKNPGVQAEMRLHAERLAKLHRMQDIAEDTGKAEQLERIFTMTSRERRRHASIMSALGGGRGGRPMGGPPVNAPTPAQEPAPSDNAGEQK
jgi:hypothetical protein